ncbi:MAG: DUF4250 domain-containing protein [Oscillospiraceae bacterium]|nr:DUF4250 domain-containing protein [Oscillospiraceae bacterium]MBQ1835338.1 DUF4250 domain-containing protein [Oscillospiraceae bacterium]MBQ2324375.1 DUF4250 domain-containing protein [Oscillospiraceae bacterium]
MLPNDPVMLLSVVNTKLRDEYPSLAELCLALDVDSAEIISKLAPLGYVYDESANRFV